MSRQMPFFLMTRFLKTRSMSFWDTRSTFSKPSNKPSSSPVGPPSFLPLAPFLLLVSSYFLPSKLSKINLTVPACKCPFPHHHLIMCWSLFERSIFWPKENTLERWQSLSGFSALFVLFFVSCCFWKTTSTSKYKYQNKLTIFFSSFDKKCIVFCPKKLFIFDIDSQNRLSLMICDL